MSRVICLGHAALDRIYRIEAFPPHPTKVRAIEHIESGGGMAANAAATIARLGGKVELWSRIGEDDAGVKIRTGLKAYGVDIRYVQMFDEGRSSTSAIIVDDAGERLIVGNRDTNMPSGTSWLPLERVAKASAVMADVRWLEGLRALFTQARAEGVTTVLDADLGAREALSEVLELTDFAIFSEPALKDFAAASNRRRRWRGCSKWDRGTPVSRLGERLPVDRPHRHQPDAGVRSRRRRHHRRRRCLPWRLHACLGRRARRDPKCPLRLRRSRIEMYEARQSRRPAQAPRDRGLPGAAHLKAKSARSAGRSCKQ